ncbi:MAG TPA: hypothetical protein VJQ44_10765 [Gemmatimonadales bacterium]|nr:hypothetical protein [Gemmatimonadales bacterium]
MSNGHPPAEREARLRPEFAGLYPGLPAGEWHRASLLTDIVWARLLDRGQAAFQLRERVLNPDHFDFRLGAPASAGAGRRRTDARTG